ncbi:hypothetical protein EJ05DRAFT_480729, partial [Pseudovirgaria hyperparasitica]
MSLSSILSHEFQALTNAVMSKPKETGESSAVRCPAKAETLIAQNSRALYYYKGTEALYACNDIYSTGYYWQLIDATENSIQQVKLTKKYTQAIGTRDMKGKEGELHFDVSAGYEGFGFNVSASFGGSFKTFSEQELSSNRAEESTYEIPGGLTVWIYQKIYTFKTRTWFLYDHGATYKAVVKNEKDDKHPYYAPEGAFESKSVETRITSAKLEGIHPIEIKAVETDLNAAKKIAELDTIRLEETSGSCKEQLAKYKLQVDKTLA